MKSINTDENPIMILEGSYSRTMSYFNDIGKHVDEFMRHMMQRNGTPPADTEIMIIIHRASNEEIEDFEDKLGIAVPTFEEALVISAKQEHTNMLTIKDPNNPVVVLSTVSLHEGCQKSLYLYNDLVNALKHAFVPSLEDIIDCGSNDELSTITEITYSLASDEQIMKYEAQHGTAVTPIEERLAAMKGTDV